MQEKDIPEKLKKIIDNIEPISPFAIEILNLAENEDASLIDIARKVSIDPVISTHLFKACASAAINKEIDSPLQAVAALGLKRVIEIILATSIKNLCKERSPYDHIIWEHNLSIAYSVQALIRKFQLPLSIARLLCLSHFVVKINKLSGNEINWIYDVSGLTGHDLNLIYDSVQREMELVNFFFE